MVENRVHVAVDGDDIVVEVAKCAGAILQDSVKGRFQVDARLAVIELRGNLDLDLVAIHDPFRPAFDDETVTAGKMSEKFKRRVQPGRVLVAAHDKNEGVLFHVWNVVLLPHTTGRGLKNPDGKSTPFQSEFALEWSQWPGLSNHPAIAKSICLILLGNQA
jgi:hypothetical protein